MNLAETIHAQWYHTRQTHLGVYEAAVSHVIEHVTVKQMISQYRTGGFAGGAGPSLTTLGKRSAAKQAQAVSNAIAWETPAAPSPPAKKSNRANVSTPDLVTARTSVSSTEAVGSASSSRSGYVCSRRSAAFETSLKNAVGS